jgi:hypothetical protein
MDANQHKIEKLIVLHLLKTINPEEQEELNNWINASSQNRSFFERICSEKTFEKKYKLYKEVDSNKAFQKFIELTGNKEKKDFLF